MAVITALKPCPGSPGRLAIHVGRRRIGSLSRQRIEALGLAVGQPWDRQLEQAVEQALLADKALRRAMRLLGRRAYSRGELRDRLARAGYDGPVIESTLSTLEQARLLDDLSYGRAVVERLTGQAKPIGRRLLRYKLLQKKLPADLVEQLLDEADEAEPALERARRLVAQLAGSPALRRCDGPTRRRRLWGHLARRGYDRHVIGQVLAELPDDEGPQDWPAD